MSQWTVLIEGELITFDSADMTATVEGVSRPVTENERAMIEATLAAEEKQAALLEQRAAQEALLVEAETLRHEMFLLTDQIIDWATDAKAYLFGPRWAAGTDPYGEGEIAADDPRIGTPRFGVLDAQRFVILLGTAEGYLLRFKALQVRPQSVVDQRDWMLQRGQEAQSVLALAGLVK